MHIGIGWLNDIQGLAQTARSLSPSISPLLFAQLAGLKHIHTSAVQAPLLPSHVLQQAGDPSGAPAAPSRQTFPGFAMQTSQSQAQGPSPVT